MFFFFLNHCDKGLGFSTMQIYMPIVGFASPSASVNVKNSLCIFGFSFVKQLHVLFNIIIYQIIVM